MGLGVTRIKRDVPGMWMVLFTVVKFLFLSFYFLLLLLLLLLKP
jgi:hypothetical protein